MAYPYPLSVSPYPLLSACRRNNCVNKINGFPLVGFTPVAADRVLTGTSADPVQRYHCLGRVKVVDVPDLLGLLPLGSREKKGGFPRLPLDVHKRKGQGRGFSV